MILLIKRCYNETAIGWTGDALLSNPATVIEFDILAILSLFAR